MATSTLLLLLLIFFLILDTGEKHVRCPNASAETRNFQFHALLFDSLMNTKSPQYFNVNYVALKHDVYALYFNEVKKVVMS